MNAPIYSFITTLTAEVMPMDARLVRTSVTIDEAVAILLGWTTGPVLYSSSEQDLTDEAEDLLHYEPFSLADELEQRESFCESKLDGAKIDGCPEAVIAEKRAALTKHRELAQLAIDYLCAINDEINKGERSALRVDSGLSNSRDTYITLTSFNEWSVERHVSPVPGAIIEKGPKALEAGKEPPKGRIKMREQEVAILSKLEALGYTPNLLPRNEPGKHGAKAEVKQALTGSPLFKGTSTSFEKAWDRLRADRSIADST